MKPLRAYHLPAHISKMDAQRSRFGDVEVEIARLDAAQWQEVTAALSRRRQNLKKPQEIALSTLDDVVESWLGDASAYRLQAETVLPAVTGFSPEMIRHGLPKLIEPLRAGAVERLLANELGRQPHRKAVAPDLVAHVLSGNIPGLGAIPIHLSLALGSAAVFKTAAGDPLFAALWAQSIADADPDLGDCLAVTHWSGGDHLVEDAVFGAADLVIASGSDEAIAAVASRTTSRFIGYGHKVSFAVVARDVLDTTEEASRLARRLAYDISIWDQQGCLSPQLCYVELGGRVTPPKFAELLAHALSDCATELPPRRLSRGEQTAILRFRQEAEWASGVELLASASSSAWTIAVEPGPVFQPTCLNRCVRLKVIADLDEIVPALVQFRRYLEAAGVAAGEPRLAGITERLGGAGVHRVCPLGKMQTPPLSWCQGGRPRVGDWVEWQQIED